MVEWVQRNMTALLVVLVVIALGAGAYWYYARSIELKNAAAERALNTAMQSVSAGNQALAQSDLQKVADQFGDTQSGIEAGLLLAQLNFNAGKNDAGIAVLQKLLTEKGASLDEASINSLIGDGQLQANRAAAAAAAYQKAADAAKSDANRAYQLSKAARAYLVAKDTATAKAIWQKLATDPKDVGLAAEARVRLGEIEAKAASKS